MLDHYTCNMCVYISMLIVVLRIIVYSGSTIIYIV